MSSSVALYGSVTWVVKLDDLDYLGRMIREWLGNLRISEIFTVADICQSSTVIKLCY